MQISDKVVCVLPFLSIQTGSPSPEVGRVYVVKEVFNFSGIEAISLVGINSIYNVEQTFRSSGFVLLSDYQRRNKQIQKLPPPNTFNEKPWNDDGDYHDGYDFD